MAKSNGKVETYDENVQMVSSPQALPYVHIPFSSFAAARAKYPDEKLYIYEGAAPGWKIVAVSIVLRKPEPVTQEGWDLNE